MLIMTGRGPVKRAGGRYSTPEIVSPSKLFQVTISGSGSASGLNAPNSLRVHRSTVPVFACTENASPNVRRDHNENATSELSERQIGAVSSCPGGSFGAHRTAIVVASRSSTRLLVVLSNTAATVRPSGERENDSSASSGGVSGCHFAVATSPRQSRRTSDPLLLRTYT